jgi:hypothetical protein
MELNDGTIIPSYLGVQNTAEMPESGEAFGNLPIRVGAIKDIIYPTDARSVSKKFIEYVVSVQYRNGSGVPVTAEYANCYVASLFGGASDKFHYTLRADKDKQVNIGAGSKVLLLCINGETTNAVIIGGIRDGSSPDKDDKAKGHHLLFEFNGVRAEINDDGEFVMSFAGATQADGSLRSGTDASASGTSITFKKNGDLSLAHGSETVTLDRAGGSWKIDASMEVNLSGSAGVNVDTKGATKITSVVGTKIGGDAAVDSLIKGTTYRAAETAKHSTMASGLATMLAGLTALATLMGTAGGLLQAVSVAHKVPVAGPIVGSVPLQAAATALLNAVGAISSIAAGVGTLTTAISTFEAGTPTYLSLKNTTD